MVRKDNMVVSSQIGNVSEADKTNRQTSNPSNGSATRMRTRMSVLETKLRKISVVNEDVVQPEVGAIEWIPPNGGYGWVIVAAAFTLLFTFAAYSQIGIFLLELEKHFKVSKTTISWINAAHTVTGRILAVFTGQVLNQVGSRWVAGTGIALLSLGYFTSSYVESIPLMFFTFGVIASIGSGCLYTTAVATVQQYFTTKRSLANGFTIAGTSVGMFAWPPLGQYLVENFGWQMTFRIEAAIFLGVGIIIVIFIKPPGNQKSFQPLRLCKNTGAHGSHDFRSEPGTDSNSAKYCDFSQLRNPALIIYLLGISCMSIGHQMNSIYLPVRAELLGLSLSEGAWQSSILGISGGVTKPLTAAVGNIPGVNRLVMASLGMMVCSGLTFGSTFMDQSWMFLLNAGLIGLASSMHLGVAFVNTVDVAGRKNIAVTGGLHAATLGMAHLILHPTTGILLDTTDDPQIPFYFGGAAQFLACILVMMSMFVQKWRQARKDQTRGGSTSSTSGESEADGEIYVIHL